MFNWINCYFEIAMDSFLSLHLSGLPAVGPSGLGSAVTLQTVFSINLIQVYQFNTNGMPTGYHYTSVTLTRFIRFQSSLRKSILNVIESVLTCIKCNWMYGRLNEIESTPLVL